MSLETAAAPAKPVTSPPVISAFPLPTFVLTLRELTLENQRLADQVRLEAGAISAEEVERKRLEEIEPGITQVIWGPDGSVLLDESLLDDASR